MMTRMKARVAVAAMLACAACSPPAPAPITSREVSQNEIDAAGDPQPPARPSFALDEPSMLAAVENLGLPWSAQPIVDDARPDSLTKGTYRSMMSSGGGADVFTLPSGRVWRVNLRTGFGDRCGQSNVLVATLPKLLAIVAPGAAVDEATRDKIAAALRTGKIEEAELAGVKLNVAGGCVPTVSATAL
jgi:hypothetical protein